MTPKERAAMQQALEALVEADKYYDYDAIIAALREALAEPDIEEMTLTQIAARHDQAEQEPVFISNEQFRSMHFSKVTVYTQNDGKEVIVCTPIRTHIEGFWCEDLTCAKCYTADFRLKHTATPRTKDLTDDDKAEIECALNMAFDLLCKPVDSIAEMYCFGMGDCDEVRQQLKNARAVIAKFKEKNK